MKVFYFDRIEDFDYKKFLEPLPADRREKALRYRREIDRKLCVASYLLLAHALKSEYGLEGPHRFIRNEFGKPYLEGHRGIFFSISHCETGTVCAVSGCEVGVDMQEIRPFTEAVAKRVFSVRELEHLNASQDRELAFARLWSRKEAYLKMLGTGINNDLKAVDTCEKDSIATRKFNDYVISICGSGPLKYIKTDL